MSHLRYLVSSMIVVALVFAFVGCAQPPDAEKTAAKSAMDAAVSAGADKYAAADFGNAKTAWDAAETQMSAKKYKEAKQAYADAKAAFEKAAAGVEAGKKAVTEEANAAVAGLEESWKNLAAAMKKAEKNLKEKKDEWANDAKAFPDALKAAKDMLAADPAGAKAKAGELKAMMEKWEGFLKEQPAAPAKPETPKKK